MTSGDAIEQLRTEARTAMTRAYAPYSGFKVGAALLCGDGFVAAGCNVENASFPAGICAERSALSLAISRGQRTFTALVIVTDAIDPTPPCGMCRQALAEFAPALRVTSVALDGREATWSMAQLLPAPFTPQSLPHHA